MKRSDYMTVIVESVDDLLSLERAESVARFRDYIRFIRYLKDGTATMQIGSGALIGLKARQSQNLWALYKTKGLTYLLTERRIGGVGHLSYTQISDLQSFLRESETALNQIQIATWLANSFGAEFTQSGISKLFSRLKLKLKTGRPVNIRQKEGDVEDFKKKFDVLVQGVPRNIIYCEDEMRYGTRTDAGRRWMPHGERPTCRVKIGYDYGLLYTALCPYNGAHYTFCYF